MLWVRFRRAGALVVAGALFAVVGTGCVTGGPPPAFVSGTSPVEVTVAPREVSGDIGGCSVTGTTSAVVVAGATVTAPTTSVNLAAATASLSGLVVELPAATIDAGTVEVACPGAAPVAVAVRLRTGAVSVTRTGELALRAGDVVTFADPVVGLGDAVVELDGGAGQLLVPGVDATLATFTADVHFYL